MKERAFTGIRRSSQTFPILLLTTFLIGCETEDSEPYVTDLIGYWKAPDCAEIMWGADGIDQFWFEYYFKFDDDGNIYTRIYGSYDDPECTSDIVVPTFGVGVAPTAQYVDMGGSTGPQGESAHSLSIGFRNNPSGEYDRVEDGYFLIQGVQLCMSGFYRFESGFIGFDSTQTSSINYDTCHEPLSCMPDETNPEFERCL